MKYKQKKIVLRKKEFGILEYMMRNKNRPISRSELLDNVWGYESTSSSNTIDVHVSKLRKTLSKNLIQTVHGFGYLIRDKPEEEYKSISNSELEEL
ncbi:winged helix-turn-helix transcriptional regulator [Candidatus Dojkabacteria bacterium]|uniref:Winged helix-turn-helix transcriptional regulator n=1 Tax=Candidatus Dojkabacteria bacterium TaxID=2099670 RepID=A0A955KWD2_9BACT|nr:winged helix-turn-helix transcriptional regulator [Candidatus Dojkabacteria bacterium]